MEPLVFIPGLLCTELLYASQITAFTDRPILVADHSSQTSIKAIASDLLDKAPAKFALVGLSMGGYVAMEVMRQAPDRVSRLALIDTNARADTPEQTERRRTLMKISRDRGFSCIPQLIYPGIVDKSRETDHLLKAIVQEMGEEIGAEGFIRQTEAIINRQASHASLANITCPTTVIVGEGDRLMPPDQSLEIHEAIPGSSFHVIPDCGHLATLEAPQTVTAILKDWIGSTSQHAPR